MKTMKYLIGASLAAALFACAPDKPVNTEEKDLNKSAVEAITDPTKGIGAVKNVTLNTPLEQDRIKRGLSIYEMNAAFQFMK